MSSAAPAAADHVVGAPRAPADFARRLRASAHAPAPWAAGAGVWRASLERRALGAGGEAAALGALLAEGVAAARRPTGQCRCCRCSRSAAPGGAAATVRVAGSKTQQLLAAVAGGASEARRVGMVVANDAHPQRGGAARRARAPRPQRGGARAPVVTCTGRGRCGAGAHLGSGARRRPSAACSATCRARATARSGDASVLPRWTPGVGNALHATRLAIAWRGLELLRVGGLLCYSACSLSRSRTRSSSPRCGARGGAVELEAWPADVLPALRRRPGCAAGGSPITPTPTTTTATRRWRCAGTRASSGAAAGVAHAVPTMWPPAAADAARLRLERCSRLLPHDQDAGGFFVALLRKRAPLGGSGGGGEAAADGELPPQLLQPLPPAEAEALAGRAGLRRGAARRRLLRPGGARGDRAVRVAPPASPPSRRARCAS